MRRSDGKDQLTTTSHGYRSAIDDIGYRAAFDYRPTPRHHILFGQEYTYHRSHPAVSCAYSIKGDSQMAANNNGFVHKILICLGYKDKHFFLFQLLFR